MEEGLFGGNRIEPFWREIPPVIYFETHTRALIAMLPPPPHPGSSTRVEGPAVALHYLFQVWRVPPGFKSPDVESTEEL